MIAMEFLYLFLVSGAGFAAALAGAYSITRWMTRDTRQKEPSFKIDFQLHPNHALHKHQLFWLVALTPVVIGLALNTKIFWGAGFDFSIEGFDHWVKNSTLTLGLMALGIPFGVMVGSFHRTLQTAEQISQVESERQDKELTAYRHALVIIKRVQGLVVYYEKITTRPNRIEKEKVYSVASKITSVFDSLYDQEYVRIFHALEEQLQAADAELISVITAGEAASNHIGIKDPIIRYVRMEIVKINGSLAELYSAVENKEKKLREKLN